MDDTSHLAVGSALTLSGARISPASQELVEAYFARFGLRPPDQLDAAVAARRDAGHVLGVAALGRGADHHGWVTVAVAPEWRRLKIGTDLIHAIADEAGRQGLTELRASYSTDDSVADAFVRGCGLVSSRRVFDAVVSTILLVPNA